MLLDGRLEFSGGFLYAYERTRVVAIRAWPEPGMWTGTDRESCRLPIHLKLGLADLDLKAHGGEPIAAAACQALLATLPKELGEDIARFPEHSWHLLRLLWEEKDALDLVKTNPALAFAIACRTEMKTQSPPGGWPAVRQLVRKKREDLAGFLEFPPTSSAVHILSRVTHEVTHLAGLRKLRALMSSTDEHVQKLLRHVRHVNAEALEMIGDDELRPIVEPSLLEEVSFIRSARGHVAGRLKRAAADWVAVQVGGRFPVVRTLRELENAITRIEGMENYRRLGRRRIEPMGDFPPPPVPGNDFVQAITSVDSLIDEGIQQHNCAGDYGPRVCSGGTYLYRVLQPERCTLSIIKQGDGRWVVDQLRRSCNQPCKSARTLQAVQRWLSANRDVPGKKTIIPDAPRGIS